MSLQEVRQQFIQLSGRYDLVVDDLSFEDKGADFFIGSGQRWLDRTFDIYKSYGRYDAELPQGQWWLLIPDCRAVEAVYASNAEGTKWEMLLADTNSIHTLLGSPNAPNAHCAMLYAPTFFRSIPDSTNSTRVDNFGATIYEDTTQANYLVNGIVLAPPSTALLYLEIHGQFYQPKLVNNTDTNMWTEVEPFILVLAALRAMEITMRNTQGVTDYTAAIKEEMIGLEKDFAAQQVAGHQQMEG